MENEYLHKIWQQVLSHFPKSWQHSGDFFRELMLAYGHEERFYHNNKHIAKMLHLLTQNQSTLKNLNLFYLAAFYHDAVYNALRSDNEQKSAEWAAADLKAMGFRKADIDFVQHLIMLTAGHASGDKKLGKEEALFVDCDLQILGEESSVYMNYSRQIRQEYHRVPELIYYQKRMAFLKKMLEQKRIFLSAEFKKLYEKQARENLAMEINDIKLKISY